VILPERKRKYLNIERRIILKWILKHMEWEHMEWFHLALGQEPLKEL
jgi:hypothetical protein